MAQTKAVRWNEFFDGQIIDKEPKKVGPGTKAAVAVIVGLTLAHAGFPMHHVGAEAIPAMAQADFGTNLHTALAPIHKLIKGFAHEIYAVFMAWGAIEVMIGKTQQGFSRMKTATLGYILLYWVPLIIDMVNSARPG